MDPSVLFSLGSSEHFPDVISCILPRPGRGGRRFWAEGGGRAGPGGQGPRNQPPHHPGCPCLWSFWGCACVSQEERIWHKVPGGRDVEAQGSVFKGGHPIAEAFPRVFLPGSSRYVLLALTLRRSGQRADKGHREGSRMRTNRAGPLPRAFTFICSPGGPGGSPTLVCVVWRGTQAERLPAVARSRASQQLVRVCTSFWLTSQAGTLKPLGCSVAVLARLPPGAP